MHVHRFLLGCAFAIPMSLAPIAVAAAVDACAPAVASTTAFERAGSCEALARRALEAMNYFRKALALTPASDVATQARLLEQIADERYLHGDEDGAAVDYRTALARARRAYPAGDPRLARYLDGEAIADETGMHYAQARHEFESARNVAAAGGARYRGDLARIDLELGSDLDALGDYAAARRAMNLALVEAQAVYPPGNALIVRILQRLTGEYEYQRDDERAIATAFTAIRQEIGNAPGLAALAQELEGAAQAYHTDHSEAALARARAGLAELVRFGRDHEGVTDDLNTLTDVFERFHDYRLALVTAQAAVDIDTPFYGRNAHEWANSMQNLFWAQVDVHEYAEAERSIRDVLRVNRATFGEHSLSVASAYAALGYLYETETAYPQARFYYNLELSIASGLKPFHPGRVSAALIDVADVDDELGNAAAAEREYGRALALRQAAFPGDLIFLSAPYDRLGLAYLDEDRPDKAIENYQTALDMRLKMFGPNDALVADSYRHLARAEMQGDSDGRLRAYKYIRKALDISIALYGRNDLAVTDKPDGGWRITIKRYHRADMSLVSLLSDIGKLYASERTDDSLATAKAVYRTALAIADQNSDDVGTLALIWLRLESIDERNKDYAAAETDARAALDATRKQPAYDSSSLHLVLGRVLLLEQKLDQAEAETVAARHVADTLLGTNSLYGEFIVEVAAWEEFRNGKVRAARADYQSALGTVQSQIEASLPFSNESERLAHLEALEPVYERFYSAVLANAAREPQLGGDMYDVVLRTRGLVAESMESVRAKVLSSGDARAKAELARLRSLDTELAATQLSEPEGGAPHLDAEYAALSHQAGDLETDLVGRVAALGAIATQRERPARWQDVRRALRRGEAAVEIVRFDQWNELTWTKPRYAALVLTPDSVGPAVVDLGDAERIEDQAQTGYDAFIGIDSDRHHFQDSLYADVWLPIASKLGNATRIYIVPDGSLNRVAFNAIPRPDGTLLGDTYDVRVLWSTKDLVQRGSMHAPSARDAVVIGDPRFDLSESAQRAALSGRALAEGDQAVGSSETLRSAGPRGTFVPSLGYTRAEADDVAALLSRHGFSDVRKYVGPLALEEQLKNIHHPSILHIATHGFYVPASDETWSADPRDALTRSGLLFAGADRLWADGKASTSVENGVFTGLEATGLDLFGTDLVVLSACGTGLGDVRFGEGVFGLTRAFHEAGARSMLVSLWKVDDSYTEELMRDFYGYLLSGKEKHEALKLAQADVRADVIHDFGSDVPWLWAGFVLIGA